MAATTRTSRAKKTAEPVVETPVEAAAPAPAKREPRPKTPCPVTSAEDPKMAEGASCGRDAAVKGMCVSHWTRLVYRADPANALKAREASKRSAAKRRAAKALEKTGIDLGA